MNISSSFHSDDIEHDLMEMIRYHLARSNKNIVNCHFYPTPFLYIDTLNRTMYSIEAILIVVIFKRVAYYSWWSKRLQHTNLHDIVGYMSSDGNLDLT